VVISLLIIEVCSIPDPSGKKGKELADILGIGMYESVRSNHPELL